MNAVLVIAGVEELDAHPVALAHTNRRPGDAAVIGPGRELQPGNYFNQSVLRNNRVFVKSLSVRQLADQARIEVGQNFCRVKTVLLVIHFTNNRGHEVMSVAVCRVRLLCESPA